MKKIRRGQHGGKRCGRGNRAVTLPRIGFEGGNTPFYMAMPFEPYYRDHHLRKQYPPITLLDIQRLIDLGRVDPTEPIDLTTLCNSKILAMNTQNQHYGVTLTDEGCDMFAAQVNIEVQRASELAIATIEKNGGTIITKFYDLLCIDAMRDPELFFRRGLPIPRCKLPSMDVISYYSSAENRGYLADPDAIQEAREILAQKYGYDLPDINDHPHAEMLCRRKDPRQIWYGLHPGWVVNMTEKTVLKPNDPQLEEYYIS